MDASHVSARAAREQRALTCSWRVIHLAALGLLFALFIGVRLYHLDRAPAHNDTVDEYAWTWSGMTFWQTGQPEAWSNLKAYRGRRVPLSWRDHEYTLVKPWLDHPPLYSLYAGAWQLAWGKRDILDADLWQMRTGSVALAAISFGCLAALLSYFAGPVEVLVSLLFYAVMPLIVWHQRLVISENLFVPLTLLGLLLLQVQAQRFSRWRLGMLLFLSALLPSTKVAALSCSVLLVLWALISDPNKTRWQSAGATVLGTLLGIAGYFAWGYHHDGALLQRVLGNHHDRFHGFNGMEILLFDPQLITKAYAGVLPIFGCVLALAALTRPKPAPWALAVLVYAACMTFFVNDHRLYGWYYLPLYPWLCAGLGTTIVRASRKRQVGLSLLWCTIALVSAARVIHDQKLLAPDQTRAAYLIGFLALAATWYAWPRLARATIPTVNAAMVAAAALTSLYEVYLR